MMAENFAKDLRGIKVVSFDLFDTLLIRPYLRPASLFEHLEELHSCWGFAAARARAEQSAFGRTDREEVTLDEIYATLPPPYHPLRAAELALEKATIRLKPGGMALYEETLRFGKEVVLLSDTYLPASWLETVLNDLGITKYRRLYVSSDLMRTKRTGSMYQTMLQELGRAPAEVLHVGDNEHSDFTMARRAGLRASLVSKGADLYLADPLNERVATLLNDPALSPKARKDLAIIAGIDVARVPMENFWNETGFRFAGPLAYAFTEWVAGRARAQGCRAVVFVARDGFYLEKIFKLIAPDLHGHYLYANRRAIQAIESDEEKRRAYRGYLAATGLLEKEVLLVDVGTNNFTTQRFLGRLGMKVRGAYWCTGREPDDLAYERYYCARSNADEKFMGSGLIEFFLTSPEPPITGIQVSAAAVAPVYAEAHPYEKERAKAVAAIGEGILAFARAKVDFFGALPLSLRPESIILWNNLWLLSPTKEERRNFGRIRHASDGDHRVYEPQFSFAPTGMISSLRRPLGKLRRLAAEAKKRIKKRRP